MSPYLCRRRLLIPMAHPGDSMSGSHYAELIQTTRAGIERWTDAVFGVRFISGGVELGGSTHWSRMRLYGRMYIDGAVRAAEYTHVTVGHRSVTWERCSYVYIPHRCVGIRSNSSSSLLSSSLSNSLTLR